MTWVDVADESTVQEGPARIVLVEGKEIGLIRWRERVYAVRNFCGHAGAPIAQGRVFPGVTCSAPGERPEITPDAPELRCPWHHWGFDLSTGACTSPVRRPRLKVYPVEIHDGRISIDI